MGMRRLFRSAIVAAALGAVATSLVVVGPAPAARAAGTGTLASCPAVTGSGAADEDATALLDDDEDGLFQTLVTKLLTSAASSIGSDAAGWLMNLLFGGTGTDSDPTEDEILQQITAMSTQLTQIQTELSAVQTELTADFTALEASIATSTFDSTQVGLWGSGGAAADMNDGIADLCAMVSEYAENGDTGSFVPDATQIAQIEDIRQYGVGNLANLNNIMTGGTGGDNGLIGLYRNVIWANIAEENDGVQPNQALLSSEYMEYMQNFLSFYVGLAVQYYDVFAEAVHAESDGVLAQGTLDDVTYYGQQLQAAVNLWTAEALWDIPSMPEGALYDTRTGLMWMSEVDLAGLNADQYCVDVTPLCAYTVWDSAGDSVVATRTVPSIQPLADVVEAQFNTDPTGPVWSIPSQEQWQTLVSPGTATDPGMGSSPYATTAGGVGVASWAAVNDFSILQSQAFPQQLGATATTIPPVLSDGGQGEQVLVFDDAYAGTPVATASGTGRAYGGQLALVAPVTPVAPFPGAGNDTVPTPVGAATAPAAATPGTPPGGPTQTLGLLNDTVTFDQVGRCVQAFEVPNGANAVTVTLTGASGGNGGTPATQSQGGGGAVVTATIPARAGAILYAQVGGNGQGSTESDDPAAGGFGGGGAGGAGFLSGAGGGGMTALSLDPDCSSWIAIAGGGGGGGGFAQGSANGVGGSGGTGCIYSDPASCTGGTPSRSGHDATDDGAGTAGTLPAGGSPGHHHGHYAQQGEAGTSFQGGAGGTGDNDTVGDGGAGGGGGGGYGGGGGGGGSDNGYIGAGGAGGGSYLADGIARASFSTAASGTPASIALTPVVADEYVIHGAASLGTWDNLGGSSTPGNEIGFRWAVGSAEQNWALVSLSTASAFQIVNPATQLCASSSVPSSVTVQPCSSSDAAQAWTPVPTLTSTGTGAYTLLNQGDAAVAAPVAGSTAFGIVVDPSSTSDDDVVDWELWLAPDSIWAAADATDPLGALVGGTDPGDADPGDPVDDGPDAGTGGPDGIGGTGGPGAADPASTGVGSTRDLAVTGADILPTVLAGAVGALLVVGGLLVVVIRRRRSAGDRG